MSRRVGAGLIAALLALGAAAAFLFLRDGGEDTAFATMSAGETPVEMAVPERIGLPNSPRLTGEALLIGERAGLRYLRLPREDGSSCWANGERRSGEWQLIDFTCETQFMRFPDREQPVLNVSRFHIIPELQVMAFETLSGFAADGVKRIAVVDTQNRVVPMAEVVGNIFYGEGPDDRVKALAALDEAGDVIWRSPPVESSEE